MAMAARERLLVIGNGMASVRLLETLVRLEPDRFAITVVGAEREPGYNRVLLSALLSGEATREDITLREPAWYAQHGIRLITGDAVMEVQAGPRVVKLASGACLDFDRCVFATGSVPALPAIPGIEKDGVMGFRCLSDVGRMECAARAKAQVAVIGGGLLGIEAACGLARTGANVTLVHVMDRLMERQLDEGAAIVLRRAVERQGVKVLLGRRTVAVEGQERAEALRFADGDRLAASLFVVTAGIVPQASLAREAGIATQRGILVDDTMQASLDGFHAIGECAEHRGVCHGLVEPVHGQAEALAAGLCGHQRLFVPATPATNLKVSGVPVFSAGDVTGVAGSCSALLQEREAGLYRKLVFKENRLTGCVLVGDAADGLWLLDLIRREVDISPVRRDLIHGREFCSAPDEGAVCDAEPSLKEAA